MTRTISHRGPRAWTRIAIAAIALLVGCTDRKVSAPSEKVTLAVADLPHAALVHVAVANGYFAAEGLDVTLLRYPFGKVALDAAVEGKADLATCAETPFVLAVLHGAKLSWLASIETSSENTVLVARRDAGIVNPAGLAGKRVGYAKGTNGEFFLDSLLVRNSVAREAVQLVDLRPEEMMDAMARGTVDAVAIFSPISLRISKRLGEGAATFTARDLYFEAFGLVARRGFVRDHPGQAARFLRALLMAEAFFREKPDEARRIVASKVGIDPEEAGAIWSQFAFQVRLDQGLLPLMEEESRWAIRSGLAPPQGAPNFLESLDAGPLLAVKPDAVSIMR